MLKYSTVLIFITTFLSCSVMHVAPTVHVDQELFHQRTWRVAVMDLVYEFEGEGKISGNTYTSAGKDGGAIIAGLVAAELANLDNIIIIDRENLARIIEEQALQLSGATDSESAVKIGKLTGAEAVVVGNVADYVYWENTGVTGTTISFSLRMIDVETGQVIINGSISRVRSFVDVIPNAQESVRELIATFKS